MMKGEPGDMADPNSTDNTAAALRAPSGQLSDPQSGAPPGDPPAPDPRRPMAYLRRQVRLYCVLRWVTNKLEAALLFGLCLFCAFILAVFFEIRFRPWTALFWLVNGLLAIPAALVLWRGVIPLLRRRVRADAVSAEIERSRKGLKQRLITAVELLQSPESPRAKSDGDASPALTALFFDDAARQVRRQVGVIHLFRPRLPILLLLTAAAIVSVEVLLPRWTPYTSVDLVAVYQGALIRSPFETAASLTVEPGEAVVLTGGDFEVRAAIHGRHARAAIHYRTPGFPWESARMEALPNNRFRHVFPGLETPLEYRVSAEDLESPVYPVQIAEPARLSRLAVDIRPPEHSGLTPRTLPENDGNIEALPGTEVRLRAVFDRSMERAALDIQPATGAIQAATTLLLSSLGEEWVGRFVVEASGQYILSGQDEWGFDSRPATYALVALPDRAPVIDIIMPTEDTIHPEGEETLRIQYRAEDDYGIARIYFAWRTPDQSTLTRTLVREEVPGEKAIGTSWNLRLADLPMEDIEFRLEAYDWAYLARSPDRDIRPGEDRRYGRSQEKYLLRANRGADQFVVNLDDADVEDLLRRRAKEESRDDADAEVEDATPDTLPRSLGDMPRGGDILLSAGGGRSATESASGVVAASGGGLSADDARKQIEAIAETQRRISEILLTSGNPRTNPQAHDQIIRAVSLQMSLDAKREFLRQQLEREQATRLVGVPSVLKATTEVEDGKGTPSTLTGPPKGEEFFPILFHDLGVRDLMVTDEGIRQRESLGRMQEGVAKALREGKIDYAKELSLQAERKLEAMLQEMAGRTGASPPGAVPPGIVRDGRGEGAPGVRLREVAPDEPVENPGGVELSETKVVRIVGSRPAARAEALQIHEDERYPAKYTDLVERYLIETAPLLQSGSTED